MDMSFEAIRERRKEFDRLKKTLKDQFLNDEQMKRYKQLSKLVVKDNHYQFECYKETQNG